LTTMLNQLELLARMPPLLSWPEPDWPRIRRPERCWKYVTWMVRGVWGLCWSQRKTWRGLWVLTRWCWWATARALGS
jgi:hypothetical protein